jgi:hypothetical protein
MTKSETNPNDEYLTTRAFLFFGFLRSLEPVSKSDFGSSRRREENTNSKTEQHEANELPKAHPLPIRWGEGSRVRGSVHWQRGRFSTRIGTMNRPILLPLLPEERAGERRPSWCCGPTVHGKPQHSRNAHWDHEPHGPSPSPPLEEREMRPLLHCSVTVHCQAEFLENCKESASLPRRLRILKPPLVIRHLNLGSRLFFNRL